MSSYRGDETGSGARDGRRAGDRMRKSIEHFGLVYAGCPKIFFHHLASDKESSVHCRSYEGLGFPTGVFAVWGEE